MRLAVRGLPLVVDMDLVPLLAVQRLLLVFRIVVTITRRSITPLRVSSLRVAVVLGTTRFAVLVERSGVVVLGVLFPSPGPGCQAKTGEATSIIAANNPKSTINLLNLFSFPKQVPTLFPDG